MINQLDWGPVIVRLDINSVIHNNKCQTLFKRYSMKWEHTAAETSEQNETFKYIIRILLEKIKFMIFDNNKILYNLWKEAFMAIINIVNMSLTSIKLFGQTPDSIPTTPYEAFHGCQPTTK